MLGDYGGAFIFLMVILVLFNFYAKCIYYVWNQKRKISLWTHLVRTEGSWLEAHLRLARVVV